jgi:hypothetical protein
MASVLIRAGFRSDSGAKIRRVEAAAVERGIPTFLTETQNGRSALGFVITEVQGELGEVIRTGVSRLDLILGESGVGAPEQVEMAVSFG